MPMDDGPAECPDDRPAGARAAALAGDPGDDALMQAWVAGDGAAFEALYGRHRTRLYRHFLRQLRDPALADDFFQDTWQKVIAARHEWRPDAPFAAWLYRIAHNRLGDHWRTARLRPPPPDDAEARLARLPGHDTPERMLGEFEQRRQLQLALEALPQEQRDVLLLRLEQEHTLEQNGAITGVGRETVKSRLRYAMDKLRLHLPATSEP
jgi:RNA polymerase sigma-70 factor (ECF subfamily)